MKYNLSALERSQTLAAIQQERFDLLVIGGGINGAGVARDAAMRGLKVVLVEASDFAFGTSSRSSKLAHGGLRYLENFEFRLVFEALSERQKLFRMAPHLVHPLRFLIPLYKTGRVGMLKMGLGMALYELLAVFDTPEPFSWLSRKKLSKIYPEVRHEGLLGGYEYSDGYMDDDRLVIETIRSACRYGARCVSYVRVIGRQEGRPQQIECENIQSEEKFLINAKAVICTAGPWTDQVAKVLSQRPQEWIPCLRPTKGVHLTVASSKAPLTSAVVMAAEERIVFGIPRGDFTIIGTTDTDFKGDPSKVKAELEDVDYLLQVANHYFPSWRLNEEAVIATYAGVRPLIKDQSSSEGKTSRDHQIWWHDGVLYMAGGKYTTYRLMAEQAVSELVKTMPFEERVKYVPSKTDSEINPWVTEDSYRRRLELVSEIQWLTRLSQAEIVSLLDRHGDEALEIAKVCGHDFSYWQMEAYHSIHNTCCFSLEDFFFRRTPLTLAFPDHGLRFLPEISAIFKDQLKWSETELENQKIILSRAIKQQSEWKL